MAAGENGSSEEVVEDESGEDAEGESSASFESEDDEVRILTNRTDKVAWSRRRKSLEASRFSSPHGNCTA